jgi:hypothetical protein
MKMKYESTGGNHLNFDMKAISIASIAVITGERLVDVDQCMMAHGGGIRVFDGDHSCS